MIIKINGKQVELKSVKTLWDIVSDKKLVPEWIVIEYNQEIVPNVKWRDITVRENDSLEIVSFVGGG